MNRLRGFAVLAATWLFATACGGVKAPSSIERVRLPRAADETWSSPIGAVRWTAHGTLVGGVEFDRTCVFRSPNQYAERTTFRAVGASTTRSWDGRAFYEQVGDSLRKLDAQTARLVFERALEAAVLFRESDFEPSLAVERIAQDRASAPDRSSGAAAGAERSPHPAGSESTIDIYRVSHGRAGFERALDFDTKTHRLLALRGSRYLEGRPLPLDCEVIFADSRVIGGRCLPFAYTVRHADEDLESVSVTEYRIDDLPAGADLLALLAAP